MDKYIEFIKLNNVVDNMNCVNIKHVAEYIAMSCLSNGISVSPIKLQKLLYYAQAWHMVYFDKATLFADKPQAWVNGPVYAVIYHLYKSKHDAFENFSVTDFAESMGDMLEKLKSLQKHMKLSSEQIEFLKQIVLQYGKFSSDGLVVRTHCEKPWLEAREGYDDFDKCQNEINLETMYVYYKSIHDKSAKK